jgi:hypothetical protein
MIASRLMKVGMEIYTYGDAIQFCRIVGSACRITVQVGGKKFLKTYVFVEFAFYYFIEKK